jgi:hypothetical protein
MSDGKPYSPGTTRSSAKTSNGGGGREIDNWWRVSNIRSEMEGPRQPVTGHGGWAAREIGLDDRPLGTRKVGVAHESAQEYSTEDLSAATVELSLRIQARVWVIWPKGHIGCEPDSQSPTLECSRVRPRGTGTRWLKLLNNQPQDDQELDGPPQCLLQSPQIKAQDATGRGNKRHRPSVLEVTPSAKCRAHDSEVKRTPPRVRSALPTGGGGRCKGQSRSVLFLAPRGSGLGGRRLRVGALRSRRKSLCDRRDLGMG